MVAGRGGQPTQRWAAPTQRDRAAAQRFAQLTGPVAEGVHEPNDLRRATALWRAAYRYLMVGELDRAIEHYQRPATSRPVTMVLADGVKP